MFNSDILEVAIGLVFVYLVLSIIATSAQESLEAVAKNRGRLLEQGLRELFGDGQVHDAADSGDPPSLIERFYNHGMIFPLFQGDYVPPKWLKRAENAAAPNGSRQNLPSYIPKENFAHAILDITDQLLPPGVGGPSQSPDRLYMAAFNLPDGSIRETLLLALKSAPGDVEKARDFLQDWYVSSMDRVSGWYKRRVQLILFLGSFALAVMLNVNTVVIADALHANATLRAALLEQAARPSADCTPAAAAVVAATANGSATPAAAPQPAPPAAPDAAPPGPQPDAAKTAETGKSPASAGDVLKCYKALQSVAGLPIGWGKATWDTTLRWAAIPDPSPAGFRPWIAAWFWCAIGCLLLLGGWLMTAFAMTLGAPFWFDVLNKIMRLRGAVQELAEAPPPPAPQQQSTAIQAAAQPDRKSASSDGAEEIALIDPAMQPREEEVLELMA